VTLCPLMKKKHVFRQLRKILSAEGISATVEKDHIEVPTEAIGPVFLDFNADTQHLDLSTCVFLDHPSSAEDHLRVVNQLNQRLCGARLYLMSEDPNVVHVEAAHLVNTRTLSHAVVVSLLNHFVKEVDYCHHVFAAEGLFHWSQFVEEFWEWLEKQPNPVP
jgi:hypothetical protein